MRLNKKASLEIGINTIVILVIAMMLLGLGIGFVKGIFGKANSLPDLIETDNWQNPPTASEPVRLTPSKLEIKSGKTKDVKIGVYNKAATDHTFEVKISDCVGPIDLAGGAVGPMLKGRKLPVPAGDSKGYSFKVSANYYNISDETNHKLPQGEYICGINATSIDGDTPVVYDTDFTLTVV